MNLADDGAPPAARSSDRRGAAMAAALVACAALVAYAPALSNGFVNWDDGLYVTANPAARELSWGGVRWAFTTGHAANWHPLTWISHMLDGSLFGANAAGHHATSVVIHAANAVLLLLVLRRMTGRLAPSVLVAALFALHPLNVESVAWISERKNVLSTFFMLLAIGAYARYAERRSAARYVPVALLFALGLMAKPMLVTLPCVLLLLDYWPLGRFRGARGRFASLAAEKAPLFALALASCIVTMIAQRAARPSMSALSLDLRVMNAALSYAGYLAKAIAPVRLSPFYALPGTPESPPIDVLLAAAALAAFAALSAVAWRSRGKRPHIFTGWFWYAGTLVPVIGLVQVGEQSMADRYAYVPLIGAFIAVAWSLPARLTKSMLARGAAACLLAVLAVATARQTLVWRDSESLWRRTLELNPRSRVALTNLGVHLVDAGRAGEAITYLERAVAIDPEYFAARKSLGVALTAAGRQEEAIREGEAAILLAPRDADARYNLANALADLGRLDEAIAHYREAAALDTAFAIRHNLAIALLRRGDLEGAAAAVQDALRAEPDDADAHYTFGLVLARRGEHARALGEFDAAARLRPGFGAALARQGAALAALGDTSAAVARYEAAARAQPGDAGAHRDLGLLLLAAGRHRDAIAALRNGLSAAPENLEIANALAWLLATAAEPDLRDGAEAVALAERTVAATGRREANLLDTLAAAYAEAGRFDDAARAAAGAAALARSAGDLALAAQIDARRAEYARGRPHRSGR